MTTESLSDSNEEALTKARSKPRRKFDVATAVLSCFGSEVRITRIPANRKPKVATVFSRGGGLEGFEGGIEVDDEFAHEGGEGDFGRFAFGSEALVNFLED
jgi:hypothetical protein